MAKKWRTVGMIVNSWEKEQIENAAKIKGFSSINAYMRDLVMTDVAKTIKEYMQSIQKQEQPKQNEVEADGGSEG